MSLVTLCSLVVFITEYGKGKTVTHPFSNYTVVMFVQGHVTVFLCLGDLGSYGAPQRLLRLTAFLGGHVTVFLSFHDVDRMERRKATARNYALQEKIYSTLLCLWGVVIVLYSFTRRPQIWYDIRYR